MKKVIGIVIIIILIGAAVWYWGLPGAGSSFLSEPVERPDIEVELTAPESFPEDAKEIFASNLEELRETLRTDPTNQPAWLDLAIYHKTVGDFEGAEHIWRWMVQEFPLQSVSYINLGNLYHYELKEYEKSEAAYRLAIEKFPTDELAYIGLHELYRYSYKQDTDLAAEVLEEGIEENPQGMQLMGTLGGYYYEKGDTENARKYFTQARDTARDLGNTALMNQFNERLDALPPQE